MSLMPVILVGLSYSNVNSHIGIYAESTQCLRVLLVCSDLATLTRDLQVEIYN